MTTDRAADDTALTVGQVAREYGVTVRTLHHYDEIGLLRPSERTGAGYRLYTRADLERLAAIVVYRRLDLGLDEIGELLDGRVPVVDHLRRQRAAVRARIDEMTRLVAAIDTMMEAEMSDRPATPAELRELFGEGFDDEYAREAEARWGDSDAWAQSQARTRAYGKGDWQAVKDETDAINAAFVAAMEAGEPASSDAAMDAAEAARRQIDERFYPCPPQFHRNLGDMYLADPRFTATYEKIRPGLAQYVRDAVFANADRQEQQGG
jgi:DNA-binding transcriptional MerR regulator